MVFLFDLRLKQIRSKKVFIHQSYRWILKITYHSGANGDDKSRNGYGHLLQITRVTENQKQLSCNDREPKRRLVYQSEEQACTIHWKTT